MRSIEALTIINSRGERAVFSPRSIYHVNIKEVTGLFDVENEIYETNSIKRDGSVFLGSQISTLPIEIVGNIRERDKTNVEQLRRKLTYILNPKNPVVLLYELDEKKRVIDCNVEKIAIRKQPVYDQFVIQLTCLYPFWREETEIRDDIVSWIGNFEFPEPDGLEIIDSSTSWEVGYREPSLIVNVFNAGDVETGIRVDFKAISALSNPAIYNIDTQEFIKLNVNMAAGQTITVTTGYGEKKVVSILNGVATDAYELLDADSTYLQLYAGDNLFRYEAGSNIENLEVSVYHNNYYLGA